MQTDEQGCLFSQVKSQSKKRMCIFFRTEESKIELSQKEEQMKEKHRRHRFQEQLERLQPHQSVTGKQPMAEKTPVLFHMVSSSAQDCPIWNGFLAKRGCGCRREKSFLLHYLKSVCCGAALPGQMSSPTALLPHYVFLSFPVRGGFPVQLPTRLDSCHDPIHPNLSWRAQCHLLLWSQTFFYNFRKSGTFSLLYF